VPAAPRARRQHHALLSSDSRGARRATTCGTRRCAQLTRLSPGDTGLMTCHQGPRATEAWANGGRPAGTPPSP